MRYNRTATIVLLTAVCTWVCLPASAAEVRSKAGELHTGTLVNPLVVKEKAVIADKMFGDTKAECYLVFAPESVAQVNSDGLVSVPGNPLPLMVLVALTKVGEPDPVKIIDAAFDRHPQGGGFTFVPVGSTGSTIAVVYHSYDPEANLEHVLTTVLEQAQSTMMAFEFAVTRSVVERYQELVSELAVTDEGETKPGLRINGTIIGSHQRHESDSLILPQLGLSVAGNDLTIQVSAL